MSLKIRREWHLKIRRQENSEKRCRLKNRRQFKSKK